MAVPSAASLLLGEQQYEKLSAPSGWSERLFFFS
jgi:hypothetical protein